MCVCVSLVPRHLDLSRVEKIGAPGDKAMCVCVMYYFC